MQKKENPKGGKTPPKAPTTPPRIPIEQHDTEPLVSSPWTRSPGRVRFRSLLQQSIDRSPQRSNYHFAVLYVDLDRFTRINDSLGRERGDEILMEVARRLRSCLRPQDLITRLREDEYLIFLDEIQALSNALDVVERMRAAMRTAFRINRQEVFLSASVGVALGPAAYKKSEEMVRDAEAAMHRAKKKGPASHEVFDSNFLEESKRQLQLETEFRSAIEGRQLRLQYEPIMSLDSERVAGFESLIRWVKPERGMVHPGEFIPMAEQTELIIPMTRWVIHESCRQLKQWQDRYPGFATTWLSLNLSPIYIQKCDFASELSAQIEASGVNASNLALEITESQLLDNADSILKGLQRLHDTGIKLWIDDFGSGYASLSYLVNFPIHALKIDRSFIAKMIEEEKSAAIAKAIVSLGKTLGLSVIAEGVETAEQLEYLRNIQCPYGQGYYFSASSDPELIDSLFAAKKSSP
ncbi:MAG TPA: bifunctional diguanylate cyclase/phosphodiesterase [Terriglobia bacterium]|nr:bifunctional diguanylate cyclase/phosphodiesterase [Terriglobia bacterium]